MKRILRSTRPKMKRIATRVVTKLRAPRPMRRKLGTMKRKY